MGHPMVRSSIICDYAPFARARGLSPQDMLSAVALPLRCLTQPDLLIRVGKVHRLLETSAARSATPDFGMQLSKTRRLSNLGVVGALMRDERTVRDALRRFISSSHLNSSAIWLQLTEHGGMALLRLFLDADRQPSIRQATEMAIGGLVQILRQLLAPDWHPREVHFMHEPAVSLGAAHRFFSCPVRFRSEFDGLVLSTSDLDRPVPLSDGGLARYAALATTESMPRRTSVNVHRVKQRILALMLDGRCTAAEVAAAMGIDRRTLHRHLQAEGTSFLAVYDELRLELAQRHLRAGNITVAQISELLGMQSQSSFSRWFKARTGLAPTRWAQARASR